MSDLGDLDAFLAGAVLRKSAVDTITQARNTRLGAKPGTDEWRAANATVYAWERKHEWLPPVYQARFTSTTCACGAVQNTFDGFFTMTKHKVKPTIEHKRIRVEDVAGMDLTQIARIVDLAKVTICINCWSTKGE